jgi:hypothetical protein
MRPRPTLFVSIASTAFLISFASHAQNVAMPQPIGKIESLSGQVTIKHTDAVVVQAGLGNGSKVGDSVFLGDTVDTGPNSKLGVAFTDGTAFNLSANAHMILDQYVYDPNGKSNASLFSLSKGAFTFIAGQVAKTGDMKVNTPVATMGIRGTAPHVEIAEDGTVRFSTLIEEDKNSQLRQARQPRRPAAQRRAQISPEKLQPTEADRRLDRNLSICKNC